MLSYRIFVLSFFAFVGLSAFCQTPAEDKAKQLEELRKLKKEMMNETKTIQQQSEWNNSSAQQEVKKLNIENQLKNQEIQSAKLEAQSAKQEAQRIKAELETKKYELNQTQIKIDSAKAQLAETEGLLQTAEMVVKRTQEEKQRQEDSLKILKKEQEIQDIQMKAQTVELDAQKAKNNLYIIIAAISLSLMSIIGVLFVGRQKTLRELAAKNVIIEEEKKRSDDLLLNILPEDVMRELKAHGKTTARNYAQATVLFADIKDFTGISERLSPDELITSLDEYFETFDNIIEKYGIEKIKTIGDAYVCAGGVPTKSDNNAHLVVKAALEFMREIEKKQIDRKGAGKIPFEFRIGIHTGQLVAGVIGVRKFAYDIWGDTVNTAARMQQHGEAGKINISQATYDLVKDKFACIYRGKLEAKNKGEIEMYFVEKAIV
jgi:class 3 adenylate cyclase